MTTIEYVLKKTSLPNMGEIQFPQVRIWGTIRQAGLIRLADDFRSRVNDEVILLALGFLRKSILFYLQKGYCVDLGFVRFEPHLKGTWNEANNRLLHPKLKIRTRVSKEFEEEFTLNTKVKRKN